MSHKIEVKLSVTDNETNITTVKLDYEEDDVSFEKVLELEEMLLAGIGTRLEETKKKAKTGGPK